MAFKRAEPKQAFLKVSIYGPSGSGKTFGTLLMAEGLAHREGRKIAYIDTERGTDFYSQEVKTRQVHPNAFVFDAVYTKSLDESAREIYALDPKEYGVIVIDSMSHLWQSTMDAYTGKRTKIDSIPMHAWGKIKAPYKRLISWLIDAPFHVFILGRQQNVFDTDDSGEMKKVGVRMRAEGETPYETHINIRMECERDPNDTTRSTYRAFIEKDRTGVLSGRTIANPSFKTIEPILPLLGSVQGKTMTQEEAAEMDAVLEDKEEEREVEKAKNSSLMKNDISNAMISAKNIEELNAAAKKVVKSKMVKDHVEELEKLYLERKSQIFSLTTKL